MATYGVTSGPLSDICLPDLSGTNIGLYALIVVYDTFSPGGISEEGWPYAKGV